MKKESFITRLSELPKDEDFMQTQEKLYSIEGWFSPASHALFSFFLDYQNENKVNGNLGEIGVWHGKSATIICKKVKENQNIFLIDPFLLNVKEIVLRNIDKVCLEIPKNLILMNGISDDFVKISNFTQLHNSFRFFHIDGCHTGTNIYRDLSLADKLISSDGIVVIDDYFNLSYPQITEALYKFCQLNPYSFRIFCVGFNKAYLCRPESFSKYYSLTTSSMQESLFTKGIYVTIKKTSSLGDSFSISVELYNQQTDPLSGKRGPDWDEDTFETVKMISER